MVEAVNSLESFDSLLNRAFQIAYFIHSDRTTALKIVANSIAKLQVTAAAQSKRLYYKPVGRALINGSATDVVRNKIAFSDQHLFQRLIYIESEFYEKLKEDGNGAAVSEEEMIIRYVKHLVRVTIKRNSFYVTLGLSRLLHNYSTNETMEIYNSIIQDPERVKDDYYYRSRKGVLMQELKSRFGSLLQVSRGTRGEERFKSHEHSNLYADLIRRCLNLFTPWNTACLVPQNYDPSTEVIPRFSYQSLDKEDTVEVDRIHAILHMDCFQRLIKALKLAEPNRRLEVPHFFLTKSKDGGSGGRREEDHQQTLNGEELSLIKSALAEQAARRKSASVGLQLRVYVDGIELAQLNLKQRHRVRFRLEQSSELIEIRAYENGEEILLASHLLKFDESSGELQQSESSITLESGQKLSISIGPTESGVVSAEVSYQETRPIRSISLLMERWTESFANRPLLGRRVLIPALSVLLLAILLMPLTQRLRNTKQSLEEEQIASRRPTESPHEKEYSESQKMIETDSGQPATNSASTESKPELKDRATGYRRKVKKGVAIKRADKLSSRQELSSTREQIASRSSSGVETYRPRLEDDDRREERTRSVGVEKAVRSLAAVKTIYIQISGDEPLQRQVQESLAAQLQSRGKFILVKDSSEADALLKVSIKRSSAGEGTSSSPISLTAQLINSDGDVLWPVNGSSQNRAYQGPIANLVESMMKDLYRRR